MACSVRLMSHTVAVRVISVKPGPPFGEARWRLTSDRRKRRPGNGDLDLAWEAGLRSARHAVDTVRDHPRTTSPGEPVVGACGKPGEIIRPSAFKTATTRLSSVAVVLAIGLVGCGGGDEEVSVPTITPSATSTPSATPSPSDDASADAAASASAQAAEEAAAAAAQAQAEAAAQAEAERLAAEQLAAGQAAAAQAEAERVAAEQQAAAAAEEARKKEADREAAAAVPATVYYENCDAAREAGAAPVRRGRPWVCGPP